MNRRSVQTLCSVATACIAVMGAVRIGHADSLDCSQGQQSVHITALTPTIFRISVGPAGEHSASVHSVYIDPRFVMGDVGQRAIGTSGHQLLKTEAGSLELDPQSGTVSLTDSRGKVLIPAAPIASVESAEGKPQLSLHLGWPANRPFNIYSCGNGDNALVQHKVDSVVKNRQCVEPFFWSPTGFASFVVGQDDAPASCDGRVSNDSVTWRVPGSAADLYLIVAPTMSDATHELLNITGKPPVPPRWTFGYLQSRWGWADKAYIDDTLHQFQSKHLPVDAFIFDFEWYTKLADYDVPPEGAAGFADFSSNPKLFPDLAGQIKQLHEAGVHFVGIRKPRMGNPDVLKMVHEKGWAYGGAASGTDARGVMFANPAARDWYGSQLEPLLKAGVDGWWNDEGEFTYTTFSHWNEAELIAHLAVEPNQRFWTINRAFVPGTGRLGATAWTGDIHGTWKDLKNTPTTILNWGLAGMPFTACDIGGYRGNAPADVVVRWMEVGTFLPIMRAHSRRTDTPHFPWMYGPEAESAIHKALDLRYRLIPVLYSLAHQTHDTGEPIMRPLVMQYPADRKVENLSGEWLLGRDLLAAPVLDQDGKKKVYLPDDLWFDFATGKPVAGKQELSLDVPFDASPLYVRGGTILTLAPTIEHTQDLPGGPLDVQVYPGRDGSFTLVEDDGASTAYLDGDVRKTTFAWNDNTHTLSWKQSGSYNGKDCFRQIKLTVHDGIDRTPIELEFNASGTVLVPGR